MTNLRTYRDMVFGTIVGLACVVAFWAVIVEPQVRRYNSTVPSSMVIEKNNFGEGCLPGKSDRCRS